MSSKTSKGNTSKGKTSSGTMTDIQAMWWWCGPSGPGRPQRPNPSPEDPSNRTVEDVGRK